VVSLGDRLHLATFAHFFTSIYPWSSRVQPRSETIASLAYAS
jgi:hypothetical protein